METSVKFKSKYPLAGTKDGNPTILLCEPTLIFFTFILIMPTPLKKSSVPNP